MHGAVIIAMRITISKERALLGVKLDFRETNIVANNFKHSRTR